MRRRQSRQSPVVDVGHSHDHRDGVSKKVGGDVFQKVSIARSLATLVFIFISATTVNAQILLEHKGTSYRTQSDNFAPLAEVIVGGSDVYITGFSVFGQTSVPTDVRWVIFDSLIPYSPVLLSPIHSIEGRPGSFAAKALWYDSPSIEFTMLANHRYAMGLLADRLGPSGFRWGVNVTSNRYGGGGRTIDADVVSVPFTAALANAGLAGSFYSTPVVYTFNGADPLGWNDAIQPSLRILSPVAEPAEWAMILAGLMLIGWVSRRRRRRPA
jgi:hypothetical protein